MTVTDRSRVLTVLRWSLDKLTEHYPEQVMTALEKERVEELAAILKRWITKEPQTPQLAFLRACDVLGVKPELITQFVRGF